MKINDSLTLAQREKIYEDQKKEEIKNYHICCDLVESFCDWINDNTPYKATKTYYVNFMQYIGASERACPSIDINGSPFRNTSITFLNALFPTLKPICFSIWKYMEHGEPIDQHVNKYIWFSSISPLDFPALWREVVSFFYLEVKPVQLSLFDFLDDDFDEDNENDYE